MSIDAKIEAVIMDEDGSGRLKLIDRPATAVSPVGTAGQRSLSFDKAPHEVTALNGLCIWGGSSFIMLGDIEIAIRDGYTRIIFHDDETFKKAVTAYHKRWNDHGQK